jgi:hypothetical protein
MSEPTVPTNASEPAPPSGELRARILAEVACIPAPTRPEHERRILLLATFGALATTSLFFVMGGFARGARPTELVVFTASFGLVGALVLTRVSAGVTGSMLGRPRQVLLLACIGLAPVLAIVALLAAVWWPESASEAVPTRAHLACGLITIVQGVLPLVALVVPRRGSDPVHPAITGAALGMTAGAWTAMMAYLRCPHAEAFHCIVAHVIPTLVLTAVGALLGRAFLKLR